MLDELRVYDFEQRSPEWFACRLGIPTASRFKDVLAKGQGKTRRTYLYTLAGEILTGTVADSYCNADMERGKQLEAEARSAYEFQFDQSPALVGFMRRGDVGCSPDSLIGDDGLLEIKTKFPHLQIECLETGALPSEHVAQVQGQLWVSGRQWCDFVSYWPGLPLFRIRVARDEAYMARLAAEIAEFNAEKLAIVRKYQEAA